MSGMSVGLMSSFRRSSFHSFVCGSRRSATRSDGLKDGPQGRAGRAGVVGSQGSAETMVVCPVPIDLRRPDFSKGCAAMRLRQTYEGLLALVASIGSVRR